MKKSLALTILLIAAVVASALLITSCGGKKEHSMEMEHPKSEMDTTAHHDEMKMDSTQMTYACPMHPEITGKEGDKCSKCGMKLEPVKAK